VPPDTLSEQRANIQGSHGVYFFGGAELLAVDGKELLLTNSAYILPGKHSIKVCFLLFLAVIMINAINFNLRLMLDTITQ